MEQEIIFTVDVVLLTQKGKDLHVVLLKREREPYLEQPALPGGYIHAQEDVDSLAAARRVLAEKTTLVSPYLEQLYTFANATRDPRGWSASISYYALVHVDVLLSQESGSFQLVPVDDLPQLSFDHNRIVDFAVARLRNKSTYSALPCYLLPELFTLTELQKTYENVLGNRLDKSAFRRKINELDFLETTKEIRKIFIYPIIPI